MVRPPHAVYNPAWNTPSSSASGVWGTRKGGQRWEPPGRIVFTWQIAFDRTPEPNPEKASEVEVRFTEESLGTRVVLEHRAFSRHGEKANAYRAGMDSPEGWPMMLERFAKSV